MPTSSLRSCCPRENTVWLSGSALCSCIICLELAAHPHTRKRRLPSVTASANTAQDCQVDLLEPILALLRLGRQTAAQPLTAICCCLLTSETLSPSQRKALYLQVREPASHLLVCLSLTHQTAAGNAGTLVSCIKAGCFLMQVLCHSVPLSC